MSQAEFLDKFFMNTLRAWGVVPVGKEVQKLHGTTTKWQLHYKEQVFDVDWDPDRIQGVLEDYNYDAAVELMMHLLTSVAHRVLEFEHRGVIQSP